MNKGLLLAALLPFTNTCFGVFYTRNILPIVDMAEYLSLYEEGKDFEVRRNALFANFLRISDRIVERIIARKTSLTDALTLGFGVNVLSQKKKHFVPDAVVEFNPELHIVVGKNIQFKVKIDQRLIFNSMVYQFPKGRPFPYQRGAGETGFKVEGLFTAFADQMLSDLYSKDLCFEVTRTLCERISEVREFLPLALGAFWITVLLRVWDEQEPGVEESKQGRVRRIFGDMAEHYLKLFNFMLDAVEPQTQLLTRLGLETKVKDMRDEFRDACSDVVQVAIEATRSPVSFRIAA